MKITSVRTAVIDGNFPWVLVRIETDEGITGLGEAYWGVGVAELVHRAAPLIVGENPFNISKLVDMMIRCLSGEGSQGGATVTAISGIEIALWDLMGRALNTPIYNLFGGRFRDKIRVYADCHAGATPDPLSYGVRGKAVADAGFTAIKFDLDTTNPYTRDISDDPHPRRQWCEPFNRTIGSAERNWMVDVVARRARGRRSRHHGRHGRPLEIRRQRRHPARPGAGAVRSPLAGRSDPAGKHRSPAARHPQHPHPDLHRREPLSQARATAS